MTFDVEDDGQVTDRDPRQIRYRNLVGQRYISLAQQGTDNGDELASGDTIPVAAPHRPST